jgi:hypothetical protein
MRMVVFESGIGPNLAHDLILQCFDADNNFIIFVLKGIP